MIMFLSSKICEQMTHAFSMQNREKFHKTWNQTIFFLNMTILGQGVSIWTMNIIENKKQRYIIDNVALVL